jgi:hypothetical protein
MACDQCGKPRGHWPGCLAGEGRQQGAGAPRGKKQRRMGPKDIPKHDHNKVVSRTVTQPKGLLKEKVTTYYWCSICHLDMGSDTTTRNRIR